MGPPPRNLAPDANDCIMAGSARGRRIQGCVAARCRERWRVPPLIVSTPKTEERTKTTTKNSGARFEVLTKNTPYKAMPKHRRRRQDHQAGATGGCRARYSPHGRLDCPEHTPASFCPSPWNQRHDAGCPAFETQICYPFHPQFGRMVKVVGRQRYAGAEHLIVIQTDGTRSLLPSWMIGTAASSATIVAQPRLPVEWLTDLRAFLDILLASLSGESAPRGGYRHAISATSADGYVRARTCDAEHSSPTEAEAYTPDPGDAPRDNGCFCNTTGKRADKGGER